jgi:hypothetical protein
VNRERFEKVMKAVVFREPIDPPIESGEIVTVFAMAENWLRTSERIYETMKGLREK